MAKKTLEKAVEIVKNIIASRAALEIIGDDVQTATTNGMAACVRNRIAALESELAAL